MPRLFALKLRLRLRCRSRRPSLTGFVIMMLAQGESFRCALAGQAGAVFPTVERLAAFVPFAGHPSNLESFAPGEGEEVGEMVVAHPPYAVVAFAGEEPKLGRRFVARLIGAFHGFISPWGRLKGDNTGPSNLL
jgi:hypothetical protein